jgi:hypothetical protein
MTTTHQLPMFARLEQCTPWGGGMLAGSDLVTLDDAARFASKHAGAEITPADFLRAAGRGQIPLRAICPRAATMEPCRETDKPLTMPENCIPTLPLDACKALSNTGRAKWRTIDGFENVEAYGGNLCRFTRWQLPDTEPDISTTPDDCRVTGWDVHSLADAFIDKPAPEQSPATHAPVVAVVPASDARPDPERRLALLRELGGAAKYARCEWTFTGIKALVTSEKAAGRKRSTEKTVRADLKEAAQNERDAKNAGFANGLGQR